MYKVLIRPLQIEDAKVSYKWRNDPEIWKYTGHKPDKIIDKKTEQAWLKEKLKEKDSFRFAILADDTYIGNIQITDINQNETGEYHIFIGEKLFWGKGIAYLATLQIIRFAKNILNLKELFLTVNPNNYPAIRVYEKCGFKKFNDTIQMKLDLNTNINPMVSVFVMTYNHEKYISQAIESILAQKTNFDFDIVVGEDYSNDRTREILLDYQAQYPGKFKLILQNINVGPSQNQIDTLNACTGKYVAICEGDDYWTDPYKLQKQVDYLEKNQNVSFVATNYYIYNEITNKTKRVSIPKQIDFITLLKRKNLIPTLTTCIRSEYIFDYIREVNPKEKNWPVGDYPLWLYLSQMGKIGVIPEYTANYNKRQNSVCHYSDIKKQYQFYLNVIDIAKFYSIEYGISTSIKQRIKRNKIETLINYGYSLKDPKLMRKWIKYYFYNQKLVPMKGVIKYFLLILENKCYLFKIKFLTTIAD